MFQNRFHIEKRKKKKIICQDRLRTHIHTHTQKENSTCFGAGGTQAGGIAEENVSLDFIAEEPNDWPIPETADERGEAGSYDIDYFIPSFRESWDGEKGCTYVHYWLENNAMKKGSGGKKTALFSPFIYKMHHFTKTGSGQT